MDRLMDSSMDALTALQQRVSSPKLTEPAPQAEQLAGIFQSALRAADHGNLRPWRFLVVEGEARVQLGLLFEKAAEQDEAELSDLQRERFRQMPLRAPMILVAIADCSDHPKVPEVEKLISSGAAVQNMLTAAFALGVGAYWRTGALSYHSLVAKGLKLAEHEKITGFIYLGTPQGKPKPVPELNTADFFAPWSAE